MSFPTLADAPKRLDVMKVGQVRSVVNRRAGRSGAWRGMAALCGAVLLTGCTRGEENAPLDWWHGLEGGQIGAQRPPPPGEQDPYPNLSMVPPKPIMPDPASRKAISATLVAQRDDAVALVAGMPLAATAMPAKPAPANQLPATAQLQAADSPPGATAAAKAAPSVPAQTGSAAPPSTLEIPATPPPLPSLPGLAVPVPPKPRKAAAGQPGLRIGFEGEQADLPATDLPALQALAARRAGKTIHVVGYGEAGDAGPTAQQAALLLGLHRAQAIAAVLVRAGVPASAVQLGAEARGSGAVVRLLD